RGAWLSLLGRALPNHAPRTLLPAHLTAPPIGIHPVLLHQEVLGPDLHIRRRSVRRRVGGAEGPGALVGVFVAGVVVPGVQVFVGVGLFGLVRQGIHLGVGGGVVVGRARERVTVEEVDVVRHRGVFHVVAV